MYENMIMKPKINLFKMWKREQERAIEGVNLIKVPYVHTWKYYNETPLNSIF
jgi:hypothetical protein